jgi:hypothetical protein
LLGLPPVILRPLCPEPNLSQTPHRHFDQPASYFGQPKFPRDVSTQSGRQVYTHARSRRSTPNSSVYQVWSPVLNDAGSVTCHICKDYRRFPVNHRSNLSRHEKSQAHSEALRQKSRAPPEVVTTASQSSTYPDPHPFLSNTGITSLLQSMLGHPFTDASEGDGNPPLSEAPSPPPFFNLTVDDNTEMQSSPHYADVQLITHSLMEMWNAPDTINSDDEDDEICECKRESLAM